MFRPFVILMMCLALLALPAMAGAVAPVLDQYGNPVAGAGETPDDGAAAGGADGGDEVVAGESAEPLDTAAGADESGALPFTGAELTFLFLAGAALAGSGLLLRRVGRAGSANGRKGATS